MKISLEWLSDFLPPLDPDAAADALTAGGLPVENIERPGSDAVLDVEVTSNRGDCLSHVGIARELSALLDLPLLATARRQGPTESAQQAESDQPATSAVTVSIEAPGRCPFYSARVLRGVRVAPSPAWLVRRLEAVGIRPINNVVDVTNYVLFETGQPLHAFDFNRLAGRQIVVRDARPGEKLLAIDGRLAELSADMLVIADADRPVALAGVMGGKESEVADSTRDVLLEAARFDPLSVRQTARALSMRSDSSYRFERGIDPALPIHASLRAARLILELAGGELLAGAVEAGSAPVESKRLSLRLARIERVLGIALPTDAVLGALARLRLQPVLQGERIDVTVPSDRLDLNIEADLVEEVARVVGYDRIPVRDEISMRLAPPRPAIEASDLLRATLVASGYFESINFSWVSDALAGDFVPAAANADRPLPRVDPSVRKDNARLRPSLLPGLLEAVRRNENAGTIEPRLFETGSIFWNDAGGKLIERRSLALVGGADYRVVRGAVEKLLDRLAPGRAARVVPEDAPGFGRGACGRVEWGGVAVGRVGRIDRAVAAKLSLREQPAAAELDLAQLVSGAQLTPQQTPIPRFPAVERDLSLILPESVRFESVQGLIDQLAPAWLERLEYVTTYRGKPLETGQKSVTVRLIFRSPEETLTSEQVEGSVQRIIEAARQSLGATLRG